MAVKSYRLSDDGLPPDELAPGGLRDPCALDGAFFGPVPFMTITFALLRLFCNAIATPLSRNGTTVIILFVHYIIDRSDHPSFSGISVG